MKLVLVHGFLGSSLNWGPVIHKLMALPEIATLDLEVTTVDLLGHGKKSSVRVPSFQSIVDDLVGELPSGEFVALGHSFGLRPLLALPSSVKNRMTALIAEDSTPVISESGFLELEYIFKKIPVPFETRELAKQKLEEIFGASSRMARFLMTNIREDASGFYTWRFDAEGLYNVLVDAFKNPLWVEWETFPKPIYLVVGSESSSFVPPARQKESLVRRGDLPTQLFRIPQSGHWVHADQPALFVAQLAQILVTIQSAARARA